MRTEMPRRDTRRAFWYALSLPHVSCALIGMATPWELEQHLQRARTFQPLSAVAMKRLQETGAPLARRWIDHLGPVA